MKRRTFLRTGAAAAALGMGGVGCGVRGRKLNVLFILVDDMGWTDLACYGSEFYETPNIDRLATQGMKFTDAYAACPVCSPTRASVMTGQYPARLNLTDWIAGHERPNAKLRIPNWTKRLGPEKITIADAMKDAGYATAHIGKWHLGDEACYPEHQGFDVNVGGHSAGQPGSYFHPYKSERHPWTDVPGLEDGEEGEYLTDRLTSEAIEFITDNAEQPFFMHLAYYTVHTPLMGKQELVEYYEGKSDPDYPQHHPVYAAMVHSLDENVGRVLDTLDDLGLADDTVVILTSDNGGLAQGGGKWGPVTTNLSLRAGKGSSYEGGVRVPAIVRWPGVVQPGSVSSEPVSTIDYYPTILDITGSAIPSGHVCDGVNIAPILTGSSDTLDRDTLFWHYPHYHPGGATPYSALRMGDWKLIEFLETDRHELYNLRADIGETTNLAETEPDRVTELRREMNIWRIATKAQLPRGNPDYVPETRK